MWRGATPWSANRGAASFTSAARGEEVAVTGWSSPRIDAIRRQLPILSARRTDLYEVR